MRRSRMLWSSGVPRPRSLNSVPHQTASRAELQHSHHPEIHELEEVPGDATRGPRRQEPPHREPRIYVPVALETLRRFLSSTSAATPFKKRLRLLVDPFKRSGYR